MPEYENWDASDEGGELTGRVLDHCQAATGVARDFVALEHGRDNHEVATLAIAVRHGCRVPEVLARSAAGVTVLNARRMHVARISEVNTHVWKSVRKTRTGGRRG